ncbi:glycine betaine ABC transporter substrate-binding protein [Paenibacillus xerothermodurans]|uniref:Osmoprotectant ABC transporter substrate-binding protein n=1 Tax=Paenibacillus xerothermodurans TaxID=1977292 RepID=A0A2W1P582_PAEXE|nr:glycine betaine ABC transporter substrate-binding protein [Paenibacillus xerothermodurans]PZE22812.1 osmoprotectant ABC transporter substrate-binding protein [Paenibacillus xerothermodurans]
MKKTYTQTTTQTRKIKALLLSMTAMLVMILSGCGSDNKILIGTQTFSEPKIIAQMYKLLIEDRTDLEVDVLPDLASTGVVVSAMQNKDIDMGLLYSGTAFDNYFPMEQTKDRAKVFEQAQKGFENLLNAKYYDPLGFENTYAFTVREDLAQQHHWEKISDVRDQAGNMTLGVDTTWLERGGDGYGAFKQQYGMEFGETLPMEVSLVYGAVATEKVDIVLAYSTDARLKEYKLKTLKDDKQFFPPYDASPVLSNETLQKHPELDEIVKLLVGKIDVQTMIDLNYEVDVKKRNEKRVAEEYLTKIGLLQ